MSKTLIQPQHRIYACFFLFALSIGALLSRLPDLQAQLQLDKAQLGLTLITMAIGTLVSLTISSPWIAQLGARRTAFLTVLGTAACYAIIPWMPSVWLALPIFFIGGMFAGMLEINLNSETDRIEAQAGRKFMNRAHGMWSLGFFFTALAGASIRQAGIPVVLHTGLALLVVIVAGTVMLSGMSNAPAREDRLAHEDGEHGFAFPTLGLLPLCIIAMAAFLIEGVGVDWSVIYMQEMFDVSALVSGLGLTVFSGVMALGRLVADPVVERFGVRAVAATLLAVAAIGALLIGIAPQPIVAILGFGMMGLGCSCVYPLAVSAAAQRTDRPPAVNVAAVAQVSFVVFFLGPPALGVAEHYGIRFSYLSVLPIILTGLCLCTSLASRPRTDLAPV